MTKKKTELEENLSKIWDILIYAKDCYQYSFYLYKPETNEESVYLENSQDFKFICHIMWRMAIIEIAKLFSNSDKRDRYNLMHFISKLKNAGHFGNIGIDFKKIENWEEIIILNENLIEEILRLRDKVYAHKDPNMEECIIKEISFEKIEILLNLVEDIIREIFITVFDSMVDFDSPNLSTSRINIIKILAVEKKQRLEELASKYRG